MKILIGLILVIAIIVVVFSRKKKKASTCPYGCPGLDCEDVQKCGCDCHYEGMGRPFRPM